MTESKMDRINQMLAHRQEIKVKSTTDKFLKPAKSEYKSYAAGKSSFLPTKSEIKKFESNQDLNPYSGISAQSVNALKEIIVEPSFDPERLARLVNLNDVLKQLVRCYRVNTVGNGFSFDYIGKAEERNSEEVLEALAWRKDFVNNPNPLQTGQEFFDPLLTDTGTLGRCYPEIVRGKNGKEIVAVYHIPADTLRKTRKSETPVIVPVNIRRGGRLVTTQTTKYFRLYVQKVTCTGRYIYFKEFGDPRYISKHTGLEIKPGDVDFKPENFATEIYEIGDYEPGHTYPLPVWINQLNSILGSKLCNDVNLSFFEENTIPAMVILVSGGALTENSYNQAKKAFEAIQGGESFNKCLFLEAFGDEESASEDGTVPLPKLEIKPLVNQRQDDAVFQQYKDYSNKLIMSSFMLSPVLVGLVHDIDRAAAEVAILMAEAQVFGPLRKKFEDFMNYKILCDEDGKPNDYWRFKFRPTNILKQDSVFEAIKQGITSGTLTPNNVINLLNNTLNIDIPPVTEFWGNLPSTAVRDSLKFFMEGLALDGKYLGSEELKKMFAMEADTIEQDDVQTDEPEDQGEPEEEQTIPAR